LDIDNYLSQDEYKDKAGAYAIQEDEFGFVNHIEDSYNNVVGFPIEEIIKILAELHYFPNKEL
jgi:septum formation protein